MGILHNFAVIIDALTVVPRKDHGREKRQEERRDATAPEGKGKRQFCSAGGGPTWRLREGSRDAITPISAEMR